LRQVASGLAGRPPGSERFLQQDHRAVELEAAAAALEATLAGFLSQAEAVAAAGAEVEAKLAAMCAANRRESGLARPMSAPGGGQPIRASFSQSRLELPPAVTSFSCTFAYFVYMHTESLRKYTGVVHTNDVTAAGEARGRRPAAAAGRAAGDRAGGDARLARRAARCTAGAGAGQSWAWAAARRGVPWGADVRHAGVDTPWHPQQPIAGLAWLS
jgi:hypothetical protein